MSEIGEPLNCPASWQTKADLLASLKQIGAGRKAYRLLTVAVSSYRYQARDRDEPLQIRLLELARAKPRYR